MSCSYGLIGEKLSHSFSPILHSKLMEKLKLDGHYHLFELKKENLAYASKGLKYLGVKGVNVTIPYKVEIINYIDQLSPEAEKIGAVNTICFKDGKTFGFNTDYSGFGMLLEKFKLTAFQTKAVILGTGGAASSVVQYLKDNRASELVLVSRNKHLAQRKFKDFKICNYDELKTLKGYEMIINCTPRGMFPHLNECPVEPELIEKFLVAVDLIYNPLQTLFLKLAKQKGLTAVNGLYMLVGQAVKAQEIWNKIRIPKELVEQVYLELLIQISQEG